MRLPITGDAPVEVSVEKKPELILMDLRMPSVNGLFGYRALQAIIGFESVPIIAVPADYTSRAKSEAIHSFLLDQPFQSRC